MDINSGDYRYQEYQGHRLVKDVVRESALSKEARRLGIDLPAERRWKPMHRSQPGKFYADYAYGFLLDVCSDVVMALADARAPDDERRAILENLLTMLRADDPNHVMDEGRFLVLDIGDKYGVHVYSGPAADMLRKMRDQKRAPAPVP